MKVHNLGFPRIGSKRELKFALESFWQGNSSQNALEKTASNIRRDNWQLQVNAGIDLAPVGDFAFYDHVLNTTLLLGLVPKRFRDIENDIDREFAIARGKQTACSSCAASDMTKWFDTNYHYLVPELDAETEVKVNTQRLISQINEAKSQAVNTKPVIIGPLTYLYLSDYKNGNKLDLLDALIPAYQQIIADIAKTGCEWLQIDEPIFALELEKQWLDAFKTCYQAFETDDIRILLATYFGDISQHIECIKRLPVAGLHIDTVTEPFDWQSIVTQLPGHWIISLGVIDGRNIWKTDLVSVYQQVNPVYRILNERLWLGPSCSLLHSPIDLMLETELDKELNSWLAFAKQKCQELDLLKDAIISQNTETITRYSAPVLTRLTSPRISNVKVRQRIDSLKPTDFKRSQTFSDRKIVQQQALNLPLFPTTTIGSFPQTGDIRAIRAQHKQGRLSSLDYQSEIRKEIAHVITEQENIGLDVLVHGEPERTDMVEYFGEQLSGCAITQFAWVQSYGSRCVKPPIIYGDVSREKPITVEWLKYAQSLTRKPVKGMLTGPITILSWSFVRNDIERSVVSNQIALAIKDEVADLEKAGIGVIQIDEPAIKEAMPLKKSRQAKYSEWATKAFRLCSSSVKGSTQIHSHMCYSEFNDILPVIIALDADVLTIETSRSNMAILSVFDEQPYPNDLGPGVYDIHSPNVPEQRWIKQLLDKAIETIPIDNIWVNPDCGLKTRQWSETKLALSNMVSSAKELRARYSSISASN
ncbi:5-methyltetrahydropteroyltriglutamate--homocysteine S-methyltransferase [Thalassotalea sp. M1531]|uniref:5-methyltetrahydropteroyltriglutamate--homocysteine methyltransferase n=1 Tax=Thalassotalea algicola TaxID=2716224 RepID=A0A7Y0LGZ6_9GAMM|nr:5-methyltetrahydropteroyltriglutamate--homocysteine S-methyltransferase [Thalassotalea algicola]NMP33526.1 5-methyltetrahydropteroyltriglutamate--homocysteine S-methyltransferase [Thalassotalea algicola]